jgi:PAS domain S-box-containing protein
VSLSVSVLRDGAGAIAGTCAIARPGGVHRRVRIEFLERTTRRLSESIELERTIRTATDVLVPELADIAGVYRLQGREGMVLASMAHADPAGQALADRLVGGARRIRADVPVRRALDDGRGILMAELDPDTFLADAANALERELAAMAPPRSMLVLPLRGPERPEGIMVLLATGARRAYTHEDLRFGEEIAGRVEQALDNARLHAAATEAQARFRAAFEHAPIGIALVYADVGSLGVIAQANPALCEITGYAAAELAGMAIADLVHPVDREGATASRRTLLSGGESGGERRYVHRDGHVIWGRCAPPRSRPRRRATSCCRSRTSRTASATRGSCSTSPTTTR